MEEFELYLNQKRIDSARFRMELPTEWARWKTEFDLTGPVVFDHARKFMLNPIRLQFPIHAS
jgi:hypothetical protein